MFTELNDNPAEGKGYIDYAINIKRLCILKENPGEGKSTDSAYNVSHVYKVESKPCRR